MGFRKLKTTFYKLPAFFILFYQYSLSISCTPKRQFVININSGQENKEAAVVTAAANPIVQSSSMNFDHPSSKQDGDPHDKRCVVYFEKLSAMLQL